MRVVLEDFATPSLATAIKANLFEFYDYLGRAPNVELHESPELKWLLTSLSNPFLDGVLRTRLNAHNVDERIENTLAYFKSKNVRDFFWWTEPGTQPADLGERLMAHGLTYQEDEPGMAVDLSALNEAVAAPSALEIQQVSDLETLKVFMHTSAPTFGMTGTREQICFDMFAGLGFDLPLRSYLGLLNGAPVGTSQLFLGAGVAGIYWVATIPEARRQGIGSALTLAPLRAARAMGYRIAILQSSPLGEGVYRRLGFREVCRLSRYELVSE